MTPVSRVRGYFFVHFMSVGMVNAYGGLWLVERGLSEAQIGLIYSLPIGIILLLTFFVGKIADRAEDWRSTIIVGMLLAAIVPFGLLWSFSFVSILAFWTVMVVAQATTVPVVDAAGLRFGRRNGITLGGLRALTTFGYLLVILAAGPVIDKFGLIVFLPLLLGLAILRSTVAFALPRLRAPEREEEKSQSIPKELMTSLWFMGPVVGSAVILGTVMVLNAFQGVIWAEQGLEPGVIGRLIALGAFAEFLMFLFYPKIAKRYTPQLLLLVAAAVTVGRWCLLSFELPVWALIFVQLLHAFSYGIVFLGSANFIADYTSEEVAAQAQAVLMLLTQAVGMVVVAGFGWLAGLWSADAYLALAVVAAIAVALIAMSGKPKVN